MTVPAANGILHSGVGQKRSKRQEERTVTSEITKKTDAVTSVLFQMRDKDKIIGSATAHLLSAEQKVRLEQLHVTESANESTLFYEVVLYSLKNKYRSLLIKAASFNREFTYDILKEISRTELDQAFNEKLISKEEYITTLRARAEPKNSTSAYPLNVEMDGVSFACVEYVEGPVGLTYIQFDEGFRCHKDVRGGNPTVLDSQTNLGKGVVDALCITGGSNAGLTAAAALTHAEHIQTGDLEEEELHVFEVSGAAVFTHNLTQKGVCKYYYPDERLARFANLNVSNTLYSGQVGAGCGVSKGQGVAFAKVDGFDVLAIVVCNSVGDIYPDGNIPVNKELPASVKTAKRKQNTTITIVITELDLDIHQLTQLSQQVHCSMARFIHPFNTQLDGDVFYACSTGKKKSDMPEDDIPRLTRFIAGISNVVAQAIRNSNHPRK